MRFFLNTLFKHDGFELIDSNSKKYVIGNPIKEKPIVLKLLDQKLMQKLLINPDLYFGEAYTDGSLRIKNGTLTEFLNIAFKNIGRSDINIYGKVFNKIKEKPKNSSEEKFDDLLKNLAKEKLPLDSQNNFEEKLQELSEQKLKDNKKLNKKKPNKNNK